MSNICLRTGDTWITREIPVVCDKGTKWFTLFEFKHGKFNYVKVWFYHTFHMSLVRAELVKDSSGKFQVTILEELELKKVKGTYNRGIIYYEGDDIKIELW